MSKGLSKCCVMCDGNIGCDKQPNSCQCHRPAPRAPQSERWEKELKDGLDTIFEGFDTSGEEKKLERLFHSLLTQAEERGYAKAVDKDSVIWEKSRTAALKEAREIVENYQNPYPEDVFIPPSAEWLKEVHEFCKSKGHTLDAISGEMGRRAVKNIKEEILSALQALSDEGNTKK